MNKIKVMTIFGTRPEATKMAPLINALNAEERFETIVCVTAQHRQMLDQVLEQFNITPKYDLNIMKHGQTISDITTAVLKGVEGVLREEKPDIVLVHGDTQTTFASALAAFYNGVQIGHVEAGLRSFDKFSPYPEEMNRVLTTRLCDVHFAPTSLSKENLLRDSVDAKDIYITGNTAVDCLKTTISDDYKFSLELLNNIDYANKKVIVMTAHRRENLGEPLENICKAVLSIVEENADVLVVYAVHKNPLVSDVAKKFLGNHKQIHLIDPIDMDDMHNLINKSYFVLTDSGGLQEEAPGLNKPVLVMRGVTERPEGLTAGTLKLCGTDVSEIVKQTTILLNDAEEYDKMANAKNPYGDGNAANRIVAALLYHFNLETTRPTDFS